jgi:thiol-disulfide isomerase/thioredoxin
VSPAFDAHDRYFVSEARAVTSGRCNQSRAAIEDYIQEAFFMTRVYRNALVMASIVLAAAGATVGAAQAGRMNQMNDFRTYSADAFQSATSEGKTTLLFFHAPWCPVCKAQEPKVLAFLGKHQDVVAFRIDYDSNVALRQQFSVQKQSTLILYHGAKEVARLSYKSDDASMNEFFSHAATMIGGR